MAPVLSGRGLAYAVVAAFGLMLPAFASAQQIGVKGGVNFASLTPEEDEDPDLSRRIGAVAGVWFRTIPARRFSFQVEGLIAEKGVKFKALEFSSEVALRYFEIQLLARADLGAPGAGARAFVVGGAAPAFKLSARGKTTFEGQKRSMDIDDAIYSTDVGLVGGAGIEFGRALIEARYTHGVRHINTDDNGDEDRIKNRVFSVMVGLRVR